MRLTAKWDVVPREPVSEEKKPSAKKKTEVRKQAPQKWRYKEVKKEKRLRTAKTGDEKGLLWPAIFLAGGAGILVFFVLRKRIGK